MAGLFPSLRLLDGGFAKGATASVDLYRSKDGSDVYALKAVDMARAKADGNAVQQVLREKEALEALCAVTLPAEARCAYLVDFFGACKDERHLYFILEFVEGGDLFRHIAAGPGARLPVGHAKAYGVQVALGLRFLHSRGWVFRDLKANNVAVSRDGACKLFDFGRAKNLRMAGPDQGTPLRTTTAIGVGHHCAPEIVQGLPHGLAVDWWSLGVLIVEMLTGAPPFAYAPPGVQDKTAFLADLAVKIQGGIEPLLLGERAALAASDGAFALVERLMKVDPAQRPGSGDEVCNAPWFQGADRGLGETTLKPLYTPPPAAYGGSNSSSAGSGGDDPFADF